jgi:hypothetical protein
VLAETLEFLPQLRPELAWRTAHKNIRVRFALLVAYALAVAVLNNVLASGACSAYNVCMQYTIRNVPGTLDEALRRAAREQGKSLNEVAIEALARGAGVSEERSRRRDLSDIAGTWRKDPAFDNALATQDTIDEELWR